MSNLGFLFYFLAIVFLMKEVDKDMAATADFTEFLADVARLGNAISIRQVQVANSRNGRGEIPFNG
ncbi:MAG: hypothetical protein ACREBR_03130 [bacterium]